MNCCDDNGRCHGGAGCAARSASPAAGGGCTHDCHEGRACTCAVPAPGTVPRPGPGTVQPLRAAHRRGVLNCDALGVCQGLLPRCEGCISGLQLTGRGIEPTGHAGAAPLQLAPGAVEGYRPGFFGTPAQRRELLRWAREALSVAAAVSTAALLMGLVAGWIAGAL